MAIPNGCVSVLFLLLSVLGEDRVNTPNSCSGLETVGYTYPSGHITLEYGEPLNITCVLKDDILEKDGNYAIRDLHFVRTHDNNTIPNELLEVINATSIRLYVERPNPVAEDYYKCYYKNPNKMVCSNLVTVGVKPQNVTDFSCIVRNYENLTCNWTAPDNIVKTNYSLEFSFPGSKSSCPHLVKRGSTMSCDWTMSTHPQYRPAQNLLNFTLSMINQFGKNTLNCLFPSYKYVVPNAPQNLRAIATGPHSIQVFWQLPSSMKTFPPGVHHRILFKCKYCPKEWQFGGLITNQLRNENGSFELINLKYAHALYDIRVSIRSAKADPNNDFAWSENAATTATTDSKIPDGPPATNIGSFVIEPIGSKRNIIVHWKKIKEECRNGQNFRYKVHVDNTGITNYTSKSFIKLNDLASQEYKINIWSQNDEGLSAEKSTLIIPARRFPEPQSFIRIDHPDLFEMKWDPPKSITTNYTIFWCYPESDRDYCDGYLDWVTVPGSATQYNLTLSRNVTYEFSISANGNSSSSGMLLATCTIVPGKIVKLTSVWIKAVGSNFIQLRWQIDCSHQIATIQGFIIYYCQIEKGQTNCIEEMKNVTTSKDEHSGIVNNLKPYTTYRLMVAVIISDTEISQPSDPEYSTTFEAAPSTAPLHVQITNISESSLMAKWDPPSETNGKIRFYKLYVNGILYKEVEDKNNFILKDLVSYNNYSISIEACTVTCSKASTPINVTTKMGVPGDMSKPIILESTSSLITIGWYKSKDPRGKNDYYQLKFVNKLGETNQPEEPYKNVTSMSYSIGCASEYTHYVYVRAVNIIGIEHKYGQWSKPLQLNCSSSTEFIYIIVAVLFTFMVGGVYIGFKKVYFRIISMKDVQVKLPPGLQTVVDQQPRGSTKHLEDTDRPPKPDPDEELLLDKCPDGLLGFEIFGNPNDTRKSTTIEPVTTDLRKKTSLRQRNKTYTCSDSSNTSQPGNYCVSTVDPNKAMATEVHYLPGLHDSSPTFAYLAVDDIVKMPNPGYIPYDIAEAENREYVTACMPKDLLVPELLQCEEKPSYVNAPDNFSQPSLEIAVVKPGYVSAGDALPPKNISDVPSKGYIPHRPFDATKSNKED